MDAVQRWLTLLVLLASALAALAYLTRQAWSGFKLVQRVHDLLEHELTPNGGSSMRDELAAVAVAVGTVQSELLELVETKRIAHELLQLQLDSIAAELTMRPAQHRRNLKNDA